MKVDKMGFARGALGWASVFLLAAAGTGAPEGRYTAVCELKYAGAVGSGETAGTFGSRTARECVFTVRFSDGRTVKDKAYSCTVPAGERSCRVALDLGAAEEGLRPYGAWAQSYVDPSDNSEGCMYASGSPSAQVDLKSGEAVVVTHQFNCTRLQRAPTSAR